MIVQLFVSTPDAHIVNAVNAHRAAPWSVIRVTTGQLIALTGTPAATVVSLMSFGFNYKPPIVARLTFRMPVAELLLHTE